MRCVHERFWMNVVTRAMPKEPPSWRIMLVSPAPCGMSFPRSPESAIVVSGTNSSPSPTPRQTSGQKKSPRPELRVEWLSMKVKRKKQMNPPAFISCGGTPFCSALPTIGIITAVASEPGSRIRPVCMAVKPSRFWANTGKMNTEA